MWRERTFSVGKNLGDLRSQRPMALGKSLVDRAAIFVNMKVTKLHTSLCVNTVTFSTSQSHSAAMKVTVRIISLHFKKIT